jgi:transcriptional regulator with PAS, ATPase and Fis domain
MEFLTILGSIISGTLEQLTDCHPQITKSQEISEFHGIVGASKPIREVYSQIEIAAGNSATVLIEGESGTGKELVAKAIHELSQRAKGPFIAVDCGAIPETLIEAELFGAKKGSYTDAIADRPGLFEAADKGTIFLDEISNTSPGVQAKLLRVLQEREIRRIGETKDRKIDVRLIAASNASLDRLAQDGRFRKDLLYRLKVLHIIVPALQHRRDDIPMLAKVFLNRLNVANKMNRHFSQTVFAQLSAHSFPGNVRELQNAVERSFFLAKGATINEIILENQSDAPSANDVQSWFKEIVEGKKDFWAAVHDRYKQRDIPRDKVVALVDLGLRSTRGSYKSMASMFRLKRAEYRRFMDFLRRNKCLLDFRPYRKAAADAQ